MGSKRSNDDNDAEATGECSTFTIRGFYGNDRPTLTVSRMREKILHVEKKTKFMEERPLPRYYNPGLLGPPSIWQTFSRQIEAIKYCQLQGQGVMVFSYESDAVGDCGKRRYVVAHPRLMWLRLLDRNPNQRCSYEVIQEHSVCKLYFDLEFLYEFNPQKNGNDMVDTFICIICHFILKEFNIVCTRKNILDLSSSSPVKFSRHLIFILPNAAFATNIHVGNFVIMVCNKIRDWRHQSTIEVPGITTEDVCNLFIKNDLEKEEVFLFCDEGVYTKNRNFRMLHATKLGKNTPLVIAPENEYKSIPKNEISEDEQFFLDSLVTTVDENSSILTYGTDSSKVQRLPISKNEKSEFEGCSNSPYPEIDSHIRDIVHPGYIRCWFYFSQTEQLVYEIAKNRYCYNISREHKSNGVMYIVNLKTGFFYQKCHDPDCRDFKSAVWPLPDRALFWKNLKEDEMMAEAHSVSNDFSDSVSEDEMLVSAVDQIEIKEMEESDDQLRRMKTMELWDRLDLLSSRESSLQGSQPSTQNLSQTSNPWDKLSQLSTPDSSFFTHCSELTSKNNSQFADHCQSKVNDEYIAEFENTLTDSDEELAREAARIESELCGEKASTTNSEIEFNSLIM